VRQQPPEVRCWTFDGADVALGLVAGESDSQVGGKPQDHALVVADRSCRNHITTDAAI
jgi:hypothetical protein